MTSPQASNPKLPTLGLRHVALFVRDPQLSKKFYCDVLQMQLEWEPDADNVYLTSEGFDNLAIHKAESQTNSSGQSESRLDHIGVALPTEASVDQWHAWIRQNRVQVLREIKTHRDGARSFYIADPDGIVIQFIYHPPIAARALKK